MVENQRFSDVFRGYRNGTPAVKWVKALKSGMRKIGPSLSSNRNIIQSFDASESRDEFSFICVGRW